MEYSIIIPVYNEAERIQFLFNDLKKINKDLEIIIIDDGSSDGTYDILSKNADIKLLRNEFNLGKGKSIINALSVSKGDYVILFDGDLEIKTKEINKFLNIHATKKNIILKGKRTLALNKLSIFGIGSYILNFLFNILYDVSYSDIFCCLTIIDKKLLKSFEIESKRFGIETEIMANIVKKKLKCKEIAIEYNRRKYTNGKKLNIFNVYEIILIMIKKRYDYH